MKLAISGYYVVVFLFLASLSIPVTVEAHPHSFIEAMVTMVFDEQGFAGVRQRWVIDEMTSLAVLDAIGDNMDGQLSEAEVQSIREINKQGLSTYQYFTHILLNGRDVPVDSVQDFDAELVEGKLVYSFFVPCPLKASASDASVQCAVYDDSFFVYILYTNEEGSGIDPTADPLFTSPEVPADAGDFQRFSDAVGLEETVDAIRLDGPADRFQVTAVLEATPEMAYFHGQIVPDAINLTFRQP